MTLESWLKISLPAFPVVFALFGAGLYWHENVLPLLPPSLAFWGVVILMYLFSQWEVPGKRYTHMVTMFVTCLWLVSSITAHNLGRFIGSDGYHGVRSAVSDRDFWFAYICAITGSAIGLVHFIRLEPLIADQVRLDRANDIEENG
jgi:hypothetical protein